VLARIATGVASVTSCHPELVPPLNVADARSVPLDVHRFPTWLPLSWLPL
jgi:hypothetical protein